MDPPSIDKMSKQPQDPQLPKGSGGEVKEWQPNNDEMVKLQQDLKLPKEVRDNDWEINNVEGGTWLGRIKQELDMLMEPEFKDSVLAHLYQQCNFEGNYLGEENDSSMLELMRCELMQISHISEVSLRDLHGEETVVLCCHNAKDNLFEFYFKHREDMASVVGVGLEYAKAILIEGWKVKVKEISEVDWVLAWNKSVSLCKLLKFEPCSSDEVQKEFYLTKKFSLRPLLWDLAKYFTLLDSIDILATKDTSVKYTTTSGGSSSNSEGSGGKDKEYYEGFYKWFGNWSLQNGKDKNWDRKNGEDNDDDKGNDSKDKSPVDPGPSDAFEKDADTKVSVELLPGGEILNESHFNKETRKNLRTLDRTIFPNLEFTFINQDGIKKVQAIVGDIRFNLRFNAEPGAGKPVDWIHTDMKVSFGLRGHAQRFGELVRDSYMPLDLKTGSQIIKASHTVEKRTGNEIAGRFGLGGKPHGVGIGGHIEGKRTTSDGDIQQLEASSESNFNLSEGGLIIKDEMDPDEPQIVCTYSSPQSKDSYGDLSRSPMNCKQTVKFQGTWSVIDIDQHGNTPNFIPYTLIASRSLEIVPEELPTMDNVKVLKTRSGKRKIIQQKLHVKFQQQYLKTLYLNHGMTHLDGKPCKLKERVDFEDNAYRYFSGEGSMRPYIWKNGILVKLQEERSFTGAERISLV